MQKETYIKVGATAGLRLLPGGKADEILAAVKTHLMNYPFKVDNVSIIDGGCPLCSARLRLRENFLAYEITR